jgi:hypothetical protein
VNGDRGLLARLSRPLFAAAVVASAGVGCDSPFGACTLIGCSSGLRLQFDQPPPDGTIVEVTGSLSPPWRVECGVDSECDLGLYFESFTPSYITVRVVTSAGEATTVHEPQYDKLQPNGEDCGPTCWQATIVVALPT